LKKNAILSFKLTSAVKIIVLVWSYKSTIC